MALASLCLNPGGVLTPSNGNASLLGMVGVA